MELNRLNTGLTEKPPIKVVQFGEGNFLRAFVEYAFQNLNDSADFNGGIAVVQPIAHGLVDMLKAQDGLYTLFMKGIKEGKEIQEHKLISNIVEAINPYREFEAYINLAKEPELQFVISNTTEAGITYVESDTFEMNPPTSFPAKLTRLLFARFEFFQGDASKGLTIIPCELINYNADTLKEIILKYANLWDLGADFQHWILESNSFHNTLVDRIVPGYPKDQIEEYNAQLEYSDKLIVAAEVFFLWVIEGGDELKAKLAFDNTGLNVRIVSDMQPYRTRKVRILNGAHTVMVPFSLLYGNETVKETVDNAFTGEFVNQVIFNEIVPTLNMDRDELISFSGDILDRFRNPFIKHNLSSIALNSISKFTVRVLPSLLEYSESKGELPVGLTFSLACLIRFYKGEWNGTTLPVNDDQAIVSAFAAAWSETSTSAVSQAILSNASFWDTDLSVVPDLVETVALALTEIEAHGAEKGFISYSEKLESKKTTTV